MERLTIVVKGRVMCAICLGNGRIFTADGTTRVCYCIRSRYRGR